MSFSKGAGSCPGLICPPRTKIKCKMGFSSGLDGKEPACNVGDLGLTCGWEDPLEKEMATHCSILAWEIPWMEKSGRLLSRGLQRVRHDRNSNNPKCKTLFQDTGE